MEGAETVAERQIIIYMMLNLSKNYRKSVTSSLSFNVFGAFYSSQFVTYLETGNPIQDVSLEVNSVNQKNKDGRAHS